MPTYSKETALYDTGAIAAGIDEAGDTADTYITAVGQNGIKVHAANNVGTNYAGIDATGMDVVRGGTSVAKFGETTRIGKLGAAHVEISQNAMAVSTGNFATDKRFVAGLANDPVTGLATVELFGVLDTVQFISGVEYYAIINDGIEPASFTAIEIDGVSHSVTGISHCDTAILLDKAEYASYSRSVVKITYATEDPVPTMFYGTSFNVSGVNTGPNSAAFGYMSSALGLASFAAGYNADAWGSYSAAIGQNSDAYGRNSVAFGYGAETGAKGTDSIALGYNAKTNAKFAVSAGTGVVSQNLEETVLGAYNDYASDVNPYGQTQYNHRGKYALVIGNGTTDDARSNALAVGWDGTVVTGGDFMTVDPRLDTTASSLAEYAYHAWSIRDANDRIVMYLQAAESAAGMVITTIAARRVVSGSNVDNRLDLRVAADGTRSVVVSDAAAWRSALELGSSTTNVSVENSTWEGSHVVRNGSVVTVASTNVMLTSRLASGASRSIGTIPSGYRPPTYVYATAASRTAALSGNLLVQVDSSGVVKVFNFSGSAVGTSDRIYFSCTYCI